MNNKKIIRIPTSWEYSASIPLEDVAEYLSCEEYEKYKNIHPRFNLFIEYDNIPEDKETGRAHSFSYSGNWSTCSSYPDAIVDAIDKYLLTEPEGLTNKAYEKLCDYIDYQRYGDY